MTASLPVEEIKKEFHRAEKSLKSARLLLHDNLLEDALPGRTTRSSTPHAQSFWPKGSM